MSTRMVIIRPDMEPLDPLDVIDTTGIRFRIWIDPPTREGFWLRSDGLFLTTAEAEALVAKGEWRELLAGYMDEINEEIEFNIDTFSDMTLQEAVAEAVRTIWSECMGPGEKLNVLHAAEVAHGKAASALAEKGPVAVSAFAIVDDEFREHWGIRPARQTQQEQAREVVRSIAETLAACIAAVEEGDVYWAEVVDEYEDGTEEIVDSCSGFYGLDEDCILGTFGIDPECVEDREEDDGCLVLTLRNSDETEGEEQ